MNLDWGAQHLRLSLFSSAPITLEERDWKAVTGQDEAEKRAATPAGGKVYSGNFGGGLLSFGYSGKRLDAVLSEAEPDIPKELPFPTIGPFRDVSNTFYEALHNWLSALEAPIIRVAFGGMLLHEAKNVEDAYAKLAGLLRSVSIDPKSTRDLLFRINWPLESKTIPKLKLNRLTTWSALRLLQNVVQVTGEAVAVSPGTERYAVQLELDHNTEPANAPFPQEKLVPIFEELMAMAQENAKSGERP